MTDPTPNGEARHYNPKFRKRKKWQGATWTPKNQSAEIGDGAWCRSCKIRHGYMTMTLQYDKDSKGRFQLLWGCPKTGNILETTTLTRKETPPDEEAD